MPDSCSATFANCDVASGNFGWKADITAATGYALRMGLKRAELWQLLAVILIAALFTLMLRSQRPLGQNVGDNPHAQAVREDQSSPRDRHPAADLTLIIFTDYQCPACRRAHPAMKRAVKSDGRVRIVYKDWPIFGHRSERAAQIAIASAAQNIYPLVHDRLMTAPSVDEHSLRMAVELSGGDWRRLERDLATNRSQIVSDLERNRQQAFGLGLSGTPGYLIGPILVEGALNERQFLRVFKTARRAG